MKYDSRSSLLPCGLLAIALLAGGCAAQKSYWVNEKIESQDRPIDWAKIPSEKNSCFHRNLRIIEYDDNGDRWERMQVIAAIDAIRRSKPGSPVVIFMHGWRNNADADNSNLQSFNRYLHWWEKQNLSREIVGVYLGWRGASVHEDGPHKPLVALPMALSFPDRRKATSRIAGVPLASDLWALRNAANENRSRLILVGHSFGGRILENVTAQSIVAYHNSRIRPGVGGDANEKLDPEKCKSKRRERLIADLVVLINPASESLNARQIKLALRSWPDDEPPAVICLSSETDSANGTLWPIGKSIERIGHPLRAKPERVYKIGHHTSKVTAGEESQWGYESRVAGFDTRQIGARVEYDCETGDFSFRDVDLDKHGISNRGYLVLKAGPCLLDDHGNGGDNCPHCSKDEGLFSPVLSEFFTRLVLDATGEDYPNSTLYGWLHP